MYVWFVTIFDEDELVDQSEPFVSAKRAMTDICYRHLDWKHVNNTKFDGTVLEHWKAEFEGRDFLLDKKYVTGSDDD